jgi:D-glycero-D-manno-heptose 1,7-bisphosphate phosphatase
VVRPAVFLDRDGTIIVDHHYNHDPDHVELIPGAADAIARLNTARIPVIVVTNQSGIGRGYFTEADYRRVEQRMNDVLGSHHAHVDASYMCPHAPGVATLCTCRKPGVVLFQRAAADLGLDLAGSFFIGDRWRDVAPGLALGGRALLVPTIETPVEERSAAERDAEVAPSLAEAVNRVLARIHPV